jgi:uncharacterized protein (TIGR01244 family)
MKHLFLLCTLLSFCLTVSADHEKVVEKPVEGIRNLNMIESTVACSGAITPENVSGIRKMGFVSLFNLRRPDEEGARLEEEAAAAQSAGLNYVHIPFDSSNPDTAAVDEFLAEIGKPGNQPAFIHCAGGGRAAGMWYAKRAIVDGLDKEHALEEAMRLGLSNGPLQTFMTDYIESHR